MVSKRRFGDGMVLAAKIAGIAHANPDKYGTKLIPLRPALLSAL